MSKLRWCLSTLLIGLMLATVPVALQAQCGNLVNGGFEDPTLGSFTGVVSPPDVWLTAYVVGALSWWMGTLVFSRFRENLVEAV